VVFAGLWRPIVALVLVPWVIAAAVMPPEHLHQADADHPQALIHRHAEAHESAPTHDGAEVSHGEDHVLWLSGATVAQTTYHFTVAWSVVGETVGPFRDTASWFATISCDGSPPHGPPRPSRSPRAPPHTSA
jgi:hypothetical protein